MRSSRTILFSTLLVAADLCAAACSRSELQTLADSFLDSALKKTTSSFALAQGVKIAENNKIIQSLAESALPKVTANLKPNFRLQALDEETCQAAVTVIVQEGTGPKPTKASPKGVAILSYRLKLPESGGKPSEVEILNTENASLFSPFDFANTTPAIYNTSAPGTFTRQQLIDIVLTYANGIEDKCGKCVKSESSCKRIENGIQIPVACNALFEALGFPVYGRKFVVDTTTNVAVGTWFFGGGGAGHLFTHEYFSIGKNGMIQQVQANWIGTTGLPDDVWGGKKPTSSWKSSKDDQW